MSQMRQMTEEQISDNQETFNLFDNKGDGRIAASQIGDVLRALGQNPTESEIRKCGYYQRPDDRIPFEVFLPILQTISKNQRRFTFEDFSEGFRVYDKDQNGTITTAEIRHLLCSLGDKLTEEEADLLLQGQEDAHGNVNYEEFIKVVMCG